MRLTEARLKAIIREEVERRLFEQVVDALITEELSRQGIFEGDRSFEAYKKAARKAFMKKLATFGLFASIAGGIGTYAQMGASDRSAQNRALRTARIADAENYKKTPEYAFEEITAAMSRPVNFTWTFGSDEGTMQSDDDTTDIDLPEGFPLLLDRNYGTIGILSPEYGVLRQLYNDVSEQLTIRNKLKSQLQKKIEAVENDDSMTATAKRALMEEYTIEIQILDDMPLTPSVELAIEGTGNASEWLKDFPKRYDIPYPPKYRKPQEGAVQKAFDMGFSGDVSVSPHFNGMIYLSYENIPEDMILPKAGQTPSQYYITLWNQYFPDSPIEQESK